MERQKSQRTESPPRDTDPGAEYVMKGDDALATVQRMFAAFVAEDIDALLATVHEDSHWTYYGANPRLASAEFDGHAAVGKFFRRILERLDVAEFNTEEFIVHGDTVVIFGSEAGTVRSTSEPFRNVWTQKYVVKDGRIVRMVEYNIQTEPSR
jgi:ketosteroid isomerase-like protein